MQIEEALGDSWVEIVHIFIANWIKPKQQVHSLYKRVDCVLRLFILFEIH